ncbi:MAG: biotin transporter BioY [Candidatus Caldatribacteriaceae bacterium]
MHLPLSSMVRCGFFVALAVVVSILFRFTASVVPFSLLPLVVLLAGLTLSPGEAFLSMLGYLLLGLFGLPVFAQPPFGGLGYVFKPTFGFLLGFLLAAPLVAVFLHRGHPSFPRLLSASLLGLFFLYPPGLLYLWVIMRMMGKNLTGYQVLKIGFFPFIGLDILKALLAVFVAWRMQKMKVFERRGKR